MAIVTEIVIDLGLGGRTHLYHGHAADELGESLLELLAVVVRARVFNLTTNLGTSTLDVLLGAAAINDRRVVFVDRDALGLAEILDGDVLELEPQLFGDDLAPREDCHVLHHRLAAITKARCFDGGHVQCAAELVHHEPEHSWD